MPSQFTGPVKPTRGTQAALDNLAGTGNLVPFVLYYTTDTQRLVVAITTSTYMAYAKLTELDTDTFISSVEPPANPTEGDRWLKNDTGVEYTFIDLQWIELGPGGSASFEEIPSHTHTIAQVTDLTDALANKSPLDHEHTVEQINGLDAKVDARFEAYWDDVAGVDSDLSTVRKVLDQVKVLRDQPAGIAGTVVRLLWTGTEYPAKTGPAGTFYDFVGPENPVALMADGDTWKDTA